MTAGSRYRGSRGLHLKSLEYGGAIHHHQTYPRPLPGGGEMPRDKGGEAVVLTSGSAC